MDPIRMSNNMPALGGLERLARPEIDLVPPTAPGGAAAEAEGPSFGKMLTESINRVNDQMTHADGMVEDLAAGRSQNIHGTLLAMQKADISFRMLLETRTKVVRAYEEVMRMQV